ncbi:MULTISPECIES: RNA polymerase recycling motor HelD [Clostridium]|uniref:UvrD-helicase domain-containing protein n=1 Tax=Clostridium cibarium TaxID=2762247 RepID=A0ABR8PP45_9CLOT|nr:MULTISPECIES: RNA polymerase recycling motor HelD [Clostridium]MBD7909942.1 UvrD-helicase domain-containing protein [Clostridium cibarium]
MNKNMKEENEVLLKKRKLIKEEIEEKKSNIKDIEKRVKALSKEAKGSYSEEKETTEKIYEVLTREINSYEDALEEPYFGRVDFREYRGLGESIYIGKKGISNIKKGEEVVVDWRAPVADLYYSGTGGEAFYKAPAGIIEGELNLKRKFLFEDGKIKELFDEGLNELMINGEEGTELVDEFLKVNLEESRGKKLKEVVATIQKEQNDIIRWPKNLPIIVQGSAGSGKTTIALHRLAYLIYRYRETMQGEDILVLAPNKLFLDYISDILPSLGADKVKQNTFEDLVLSKLKMNGKIYNKDEKLKSILEEKNEEKRKLIVNSSKVKGTLVYKTMIDRYIALVESRALDIHDITIEGEVIFSKKEIIRLYLKDLKSYPINKRKDEIKRYLNLKIRERLAQILNKIDTEWNFKIKDVKAELEDSEERRKKLIAIYDARDAIKDNINKNLKKEFNLYFKNWRGISSKDIYYNFFNDEELFSIATDDKIPEILADYMRGEFNSNYEKNIIDEDDLAALLYIRVLLEGIEEKEKFKHIVVDEAQDYSPFQIFLVNKLSKGNSLTLVGDLAQGIYYYKGVKTWEDITKGLFNGEATYIQLTQSYRSTVEIIDFAEKALLAQNLGLKNAKPVLRHGEKPKTIKVDSEEEYASVLDSIIDEVKEKGKNTVAIITKNSEEALELSQYLKKKSKYKFQLIKGKEKEVSEELIILPSYITKGLEFDCTIILNPSEENYGENLLDERLLYVALTRALHLEYIIENEKISYLINKSC